MARTIKTRQKRVAGLKAAPTRSGIHAAIMAALGFASGQVIAADAAKADTAGGLEEIIVTATKRAEKLQDVPLAVQAMSNAALQQQNVATLNDILRTMPTVHAASTVPGVGEVYIRGIVSDAVNPLVAGAQGTLPVVATYLDEQPLSMIAGRNLDIYSADLERVEVLPGPQGTLFGASSMAGTVRLITRKPELNKFEVGGTLGTAFTQHGSQSHSVQGFVNIPVNDKLAVRVVAYSDSQGGYIDNVYGVTKVDPAVNPTLPSAPGTTYETANNSQFVRNKFNDASYTGDRIGVKYLINDNWNVYVQHLDQRIKTEGVFDYDPAIGDLKVSRYFPDFNDDTAHQTSWTLNGDLGALDLIYTGAYLKRDVQASTDYTGYNNVGGYIAYYTCTYATATDPNRHCLNPVKGDTVRDQFTRLTNEFRLTTDSKARLRGTAGVFLDHVDAKTDADTTYGAETQLPGAQRLTPPAGTCELDPSTRPLGVGFINCVEHKERQLAFFGEASYDLVPKVLTLTGGLRHYDLTDTLRGISQFSVFSSVPVDPVPFAGRNYTTRPSSKKTGTIPKATISWKVAPDKMLYATYSKSFRAGGLNRKPQPAIDPRYSGVAPTFNPDTLVNYELGFKLEGDGGKLRLNGDVYQMDWKDMQVAVFDPIHVSKITFIENAAAARIRGFESDLSYAATRQLTVWAAVSLNDAKVSAINAGVNGVAPVGSALPLTPKFAGNVRLRYEASSGDASSWYVQGALQYAGSSYSTLILQNRFSQPGYTTVDASVGIKRERYGVELYGQNITDRRADLFTNNWDDVPRIVTNRPATFGLRVFFDVK